MNHGWSLGCLWGIIHVQTSRIPVGTWRNNNVIITSKRHCNVVFTYWWCYHYIMCPSRWKTRRVSCVDLQFVDKCCTDLFCWTKIILTTVPQNCTTTRQYFWGFCVMNICITIIRQHAYYSQSNLGSADAWISPAIIHIVFVCVLFRMHVISISVCVFYFLICIFQRVWDHSMMNPDVILEWFLWQTLNL